MDERNIPPKLLEAEKIEMTLAAKVNQEGIVDLIQSERLLYSYLPTAESKYLFPVLVNTSFLTSANRESIHKDSKWNQWIFENISYEIFKWIAELVQSTLSVEAYRLIPKKTTYNDDLAKSYNKGIEKAKKEVPFIISRKNKLIKLDETIIDFTFLSEKRFVGEESILKFVTQSHNTQNTLQYAKYCSFSSNLKTLGSMSLEWNDLHKLLASIHFLESHNIEKNIELLNYLYLQCNNSKAKEVTEEFVSKLPFVMNHKEYLCTPSSVCFPTENDEHWDSQDSEILFIHRDILSWVLTKSDIKNWLQNLGVKEKTDTTYIKQIIIPHIENYITFNNAIIEMQKLFQLYRKNDLSESLMSELSEIKLLTNQGTLLKASNCYLSNYYNPRLKLEDLIKEDIFVSDRYCVDLSEKDEWRRFFNLLGVQQGIEIVKYERRAKISILLNKGMKEEYFNTNEFLFYNSYFRADEFRNVVSLTLLNDIPGNYKLADAFWYDYIENHEPLELECNVTAYWGYGGRTGRNSGDYVANYLPWFIKNVKCIPTTMKKLELSTSVFLNIDENIKLGGKYLPIFSGPVLSQNWRSFFSFKTTFQINDYLDILGQIALDIKEGEILSTNKDRVQDIYSVLLDECANWSSGVIEYVSTWSENNKLLNTNNSFTKSSSLKYYLDGNEAIFQGQYNFIQLNAKNKIHQNLESFLSYFQIGVLKQNQFKLIHNNAEECLQLKNKLNDISSYFKIWVEYYENDDKTLLHLLEIQDKLSSLNILRANTLEITYPEIGFSKEVNLHFDNNELYVTTPWNSNYVLLKLPELLCRYFELEGHESKLDFLLRSKMQEIQQYFKQESMEFPQDWIIKNEESSKDTQIVASNDFYERSEQDFDKKSYIENLIPRAVENVIKHLETLYEYDCAEASPIPGKSVILGIKKSGAEIAIVARPSDNEKIRLFYESEFDILEYADAELWYEDGITLPRQFTLGKLLKMKGINKIPVKKINFKDIELHNPKSENLEFNAIPYSPEKTAHIIASFANTSGGTLIFGVKEQSKTENEVVGLSTDFRIDEIVKKAVSLLSVIPTINCNWMIKGKEYVFVIEVEKSEDNILVNSQKYIRCFNSTVLETGNFNSLPVVNKLEYDRTFAVVIIVGQLSRQKNNSFLMNLI